MSFFSCCCWWRRHNETAIVCPPELVQQLKTDTPLTGGQIRHLYSRFCLIGTLAERDDPPMHLLKRNFLAMPHFRRNPLFLDILSSLFADKKVLSFVDFATYLSVFQGNSLSTKKEQLELAKKNKLRILFDMYDTSRDGCIDTEDLIKIVHKLFADLMDKQQILNIVSIMMSEMDSTCTHKILFDDFRRSLAVFDMEEKLVTTIPEARGSN